MTAKNGIIYAKNIMQALVEYAPQNKAIFEKNFLTYKKQLEQLDIYIFQEIEKIPKKQRVLITSHDAFQYFGRYYGVRLESILGTSTDAEAQTADVMRVQKVIKVTGLPAVFIESTINPKLLKQIAEDNEVEIGGELYSDSLGDLGGNGETYLKMLRHNAATIAYALKGDLNATESSAYNKEENTNLAVDKTNEKVEMAAESNQTDWILGGVLGVLLAGGFGFMYRKMNV
jgi:manganese/iron transport system substrate-binding protein